MLCLIEYTHHGMKVINLMWIPSINCACEHMYPMWKFRELNKPVLQEIPYMYYSLQMMINMSDHINCVNSEEELIDQAGIKDVMYSGAKLLSNKSTRFMVIGR